jgi:hypothetical protein
MPNRHILTLKIVIAIFSEKLVNVQESTQRIAKSRSYFHRTPAAKIEGQKLRKVLHFNPRCKNVTNFVVHKVTKCVISVLHMLIWFRMGMVIRTVAR